MELVLLGIAVVSLIVALVMSATAWRINRDERVRADARVAALNAAVGESEKPARPQPQPQVQPEPQVKVQPAVEAAVAADPVAVNESRGSTPPWSTARVSTFAIPGRAARAADVAIHPPSPDMFPAERTLGDRPASDAAPAERIAVGDSFLGTAAPESGGRQRTLAIAAAVLFVVFLVGGYRTVFGSRTPVTAAASAPAATSPLELVSLRHERRGGRLAVTGLVRNPAGGTPLDKLDAVVFLFDQGGSFISSARAGIEYAKFSPGDESPFVIAVDAPSTVARYRVSFRTDAGIVPHIDRRAQEQTSSAAGQEPATSR